MSNNVTSPKSTKEKEVQLLHLDGLQREILANVIEKFLQGAKIEITEAIEALQRYVLNLAEISSSGEKSSCNDEGSLSESCKMALRKFTDAICLCSKYQIDHYKIFLLPDVMESFIKASGQKDKFTAHHMNELGYRVKINAYAMLEADERKIGDYVAGMEDFYLKSLASVNPAIAKRTFVEHIVGMFVVSHNHTISDISHIANKYAEYLGATRPEQDKIEALVHRYSDISNRLHEGYLQSAKVEVFKLLEGL